MICTKEGLLLYEGAGGPGATPIRVRDILGERLPYVRIERHNRLAMLTTSGDKIFSAIHRRLWFLTDRLRCSYSGIGVDRPIVIFPVTTTYDVA